MKELQTTKITIMKYLILIFLLTAGLQTQAQKMWTQTGDITFYSKAPLEDIEAENHSVSSVINMENGDIVFSLLISAFEFEKALMQEHFNEKYLHSDKFPKSTFKGKIQNVGSISMNKPGTYELDVSGELTIHGQTNPVSTTMSFTIEDENKMEATSEFIVTLADYQVEIPKMVKENISETILIKVNMDYVPFKK